MDIQEEKKEVKKKKVVHMLTQEERSRGGANSRGNFKHDPNRAREAGKKGGSK